MRLIFPAKHSALLISLVSAALISPLTWAAPPAGGHQHSHATAQPSGQGSNSGAMAAMRDMQAMHGKMMAANTSAERQALMADHMKAMQEGMKAMQQMGSCCGRKGMSRSMATRMDTMTMMQMMGGMGMNGMMEHSALTLASARTFCARPTALTEAVRAGRPA